MLQAKNLSARRSWAFLLVLTGMFSVPAMPGCGGDDDEAAAGKSGTAGSTAGASGTAGVAGDAGTAGNAGNAGTAGGDACIGGVIVNGVCEGKCTPDKCVEGNTCVGNRCVLKCDAHSDCLAGQDCAPAKEDDTQADLTVCSWTGLAEIGTSCPNKTECDSLGTCADGKSCDFAQCGGAACVKDTASCGDNANCSRGLCPDNSPCIVPGCTQDQCTPLTCRTAGLNDLTAYCVSADCHADADCGGGFVCATIRDPHELCDSSPVKGNNTFCGKTDDPCVASADFTANGHTYSEGSICLLRNRCQKRSVCDPCETDLDCSQIPGQKCFQTATDKRCAAACNANADCGPEFRCKSGACLPQYESGTCIGTGQFCEPCNNDNDCLGGGDKMACVSIGSLGERACLDESFSTACTTDVDCPLSPSGKHGHCLNTDDGVATTDAVYHHCYLVQASSGNFQCW